MTWLRAILAGGLSVLVPGAGHALLRDWFRAVGFASVFVAALVLLLPTNEVAAADSIGQGVVLAAEETATPDRFALSFIALFAAIDATVRATASTGAGADEEATCPQCGKELDDDLSFCHWCTTRLESESVEDGPA